MKLVINESIWTHGAESWMEFVHSLRIVKPSNASKTVPDVTIHWNAKVLVKIKRPSKELLESEVAALADEYQKPLEELTALLTKRKVRIMNAEGIQVNGREPKRKSGRKPKAKANDGSVAVTGTHDGEHQQQQPGAAADMHAQGALRVEPEAEIG